MSRVFGAVQMNYRIVTKPSHFPLRRTHISKVLGILSCCAGPTPSIQQFEGQLLEGWRRDDPQCLGRFLAENSYAMG